MIEYAKNLADFAVASGKKHVVVLSGLDFGRLQRIDMSRYIYFVEVFFFFGSVVRKLSISRHQVNQLLIFETAYCRVFFFTRFFTR